MRRTRADLLGYRAVVTSDDGAATEAKAFSRRGAEVARVVLVGHETVHAERELDAALQLLCTAPSGPPPVVAFSTGIAVDAWYRAAAATGRVLELREALRAATVVTTVAAEPAACRYGIDAAEVVWPRDVASVAQAVGSRTPGTVFLARHGSEPVRAAARLRQSGWQVVDLPVPLATFTPNVAGDDDVDSLVRAIAHADIDAVSLVSAVGVERLVDRARRLDLLDALTGAARDRVALCAARPMVAGAARLAGLTVSVASRDRVATRVDEVARAVSVRRRVLCADPVSVVVQGGVVIVDGNALWLSAPARRVVETLAQRHGGVVDYASLMRAAMGSVPDASGGDDTLARAVAEATALLASAGAAIVGSDGGLALHRTRG